MAATTAIGISAASGIYSAYQASKTPKAAATPADVLLNAPSRSNDALAASRAGEVAANLQRKRAAAAQGPRSTILTSPQGLNTPAPGRTLLLGQ